MTEFLLGLALGAGCAIIVWVGLFEASRQRAGWRDAADGVSQRNDESRGVVRGPFQS